MVQIDDKEKSQSHKQVTSNARHENRFSMKNCYQEERRKKIILVIKKIRFFSSHQWNGNFKSLIISIEWISITIITVIKIKSSIIIIHNIQLTTTTFWSHTVNLCELQVINSIQLILFNWMESIFMHIKHEQQKRGISTLDLTHNYYTN